MKTKLTLLATTAAAALALATPAQAAGTWYAGVFGGANWATDQSFSVATTPTTSADTLTWATDGEAGFIVGGAVGLHLNQLMSGLRAEAEVAWRQNTVDGLWTSNTGTPTAVSSGTLDYDHSTFSVMANLWYDVDVGGISPYIGGGVGWAETELDGNYLGIPQAFSFSDSGFAWQLGAGVNFDISSNVKLGVGYRYFEGPDVTVAAPAGNASTFDVDSENHSAIVSLTFGM